MTIRHPFNAVIADDERLMRDQLRLRLSEVWPELIVVAEARNGLEAVECVDRHRPDVVFLDIRMPGISGVDAAREILQLDYGEEETAPEIVFITAYDQYAVQAFEHGAVDYVLKPAQADRLKRTRQRVLARLVARGSPELGAVDDAHEAMGTGTGSPAAMQQLLQSLSAQISGHAGGRLEIIQASVGSSILMIPVSEVLFFISDEKYTRVQTGTAEALIRKPIKELVAELDPQRLWQIHRSTIVNVQAVESVVRDERGRQMVSVRGHAQKLEVSRSFAGVFKGM